MDTLLVTINFLLNEGISETNFFDDFNVRRKTAKFCGKQGLTLNHYALLWNCTQISKAQTMKTLGYQLVSWETENVTFEPTWFANKIWQSIYPCDPRASFYFC